MIDGSYKICCNPMLLGVLVYYGGIVVCLHTWQAAAIFAAFHIVMGNRQPRRKSVWSRIPSTLTGNIKRPHAS